jgi:hypothetical protein
LIISTSAEIVVILPLEGSVAEEVSHQDVVVPFHHNRHGDESRPEDGFAVGLDFLEELLSMLRVRGTFPIFDGGEAKLVFNMAMGSILLGDVHVLD